MADTLSLGDRGITVCVLHHILSAQGFNCGGPDTLDSIFGITTDSAVKLFQASHIGPNAKNLVVDGVVGPATWWALDHPSGSHQYQPIDDMPVQTPSNPIAATALISAVAEEAKGVHEDPDGSNRGPEIDLYTGMGGKPLHITGPLWCAYFASWNFSKAPGGSPFGKISGAQSIAFWCRKHIPGSVFDLAMLPLYTPKCGDLLIIANGQIHGHVVQARAVLNDYAWAVEGNCANAVRFRKHRVSSFKWAVNFDSYAASEGIHE